MKPKIQADSARTDTHSIQWRFEPSVSSSRLPKRSGPIQMKNEILHGF